MLNQINYITKLTTYGITNLIIYLFIGLVSVLLSFLIGLVYLIYNIDVTYDTIVSISALKAIFMAAPVQIVLLFLIGASAYLIFTNAYQFAIKKVIAKLLAEKSDSFLNPLLDKIIGKLKKELNLKQENGNTIQNAEVTPIGESVSVVSHEENNWLFKRINAVLNKKILGDLHQDLGALDSDEAIKQKVISKLKNYAETSMKNLWIVVVFHWVALLFIIFL